MIQINKIRDEKGDITTEIQLYLWQKYNGSIGIIMKNYMLPNWKT
jgi:hypothetical protein